MVSKKQVEKMSRKLYNNRDKKELYFMTNSIYTEIKKRIKLAESGTVFLTSDFTDLATTTTVRKYLGRQVEEKNIRRIMDGVYEKPVYSNLLNEYIPANPEKVAYAIARSFRWTIAPCGDVALNKLGLRLEIGPLAEWLPSHETSITPFAAEKYPDIFSQTDTSVLTIDVERTFWEKLTILHKIANFPEGKSLPARYARHLYDVYNMGNSWVKESAFKRKELLEKDVAFKQKFYYAKGAHYETATLSSIELLPKEAVLNALKEDYQAMSNMIYGNIPEFEDILAFLKKLQSEIHELSNTKL